MAARATRSASGAASSRDGDSRCLLLALSHDELGVIVDGLADPLQPVVAVALSSTCKGLRTPVVVKDARLILMQRHWRAVALCRKLDKSCLELGDAEELKWQQKGLTSDDAATLCMIVRTNGLRRLKRLYLRSNSLGDAGAQALCEGLDCDAAPSLRSLDLSDNQLGPAGAIALATALSRGAMPKLVTLFLSCNPFGNQGMVALAAPLHKMPALRMIHLSMCEIGDEGVASLVDNLGKDDFKALEKLFLSSNKINDAGMSTLVAAIDAGRLPKMISHTVRAPNLELHFLGRNPSSASAVQAVEDALAKRSS